MSSVSIGGTNATIYGQAGDATSGTNVAAIVGRVVSAGSHNVTVVWGGAMTRMAAGVYLVEGYASTTPYDVDVKTAGMLVFSLSSSLDYPDQGKGIYGACLSATGASATWSAASAEALLLAALSQAQARELPDFIQDRVLNA